jgi:hypothetical protein
LLNRILHPKSIHKHLAAGKKLGRIIGPLTTEEMDAVVGVTWVFVI